MALFADGSLPKQTPSPLAPKPTGTKQASTPSYGYMPPMISDSKVNAQTNNLYAASAGAGRSAMQSMDRAGISRGRGQQMRADMAQAGADVQAATGAAKVEMGVQDANQRARQAYETTMRGEQLGNAGLLENLRSANVRERYAKQGWQQDLQEAIRRGQFGLDSIYLDRTPLIESLLRS
jgi:membrane-bound ClpP family serine protease